MMKLFYLLSIIFPMALILGCGDQDAEKEDLKEPQVVSVNVGEGWEIPLNSTIVVTFNRDIEPESVVITLNGVPVSAFNEGRTFRFKPVNEGEAKLEISIKDTNGQSFVPAYKPIKFVVFGVDNKSPQIIDSKCEPKNGAIGVDPAKYTKELLIAFTEPIAEAEVVYTSPEDIRFSEKLREDGLFLTLSFNKYGLPNETKCYILLNTIDIAGNSSVLEYSFKTMESD